MPISISISVPKTDGMDSKRIMNALRKASPVLVEKLLPIIRARTPRDTGALREALEGKAYPSEVSGNRESQLAQFWYDDQPQIDEWKRVYAPYQEGPELGLSTYTNEPRRMLQQIGTTDQDLIDQWAEAAIQEALDQMAHGSTTLNG